MKFFLLLLLSILFSTSAQTMKIYFMGIRPESATSFDKTFERQLREHLEGEETVVLATIGETALLDKRTEFKSQYTINRRFVQKLQEFNENRVLVLWGEISDFSIKPVRRMIIDAVLEAKATFSLYMYSLIFKDYVYVGNVTITTEIEKPAVFFGNVRKITNISATDRLQIDENLCKKASRIGSDIVSGVVSAELIRSGIMPNNVNKQRVNTVSDLFEIPSISAPHTPLGTMERRPPQARPPTP